MDKTTTSLESGVGSYICMLPEGSEWPYIGQRCGRCRCEILRDFCVLKHKTQFVCVLCVFLQQFGPVLCCYGSGKRE